MRRFEEEHKFREEIEKLPADQRQAKINERMQQHLSNSEGQAKMESDFNAMHSQMTPSQRTNFFKNYVQQKRKQISQ